MLKTPTPRRARARVPVRIRSAQELREHLKLLDHAGWIRVTRNAQGRLVQLIIGTANIALGAGRLQATGTVRPPSKSSPPVGSA
jgi:hypothetical protein